MSKMIHATDPIARRVSVFQGARRLEAVTAIEPETGEIIQCMQGDFSNPVLKFFLGLIGIAVYHSFDTQLLGRGDELLSVHYFLRRPFDIKYEENKP